MTDTPNTTQGKGAIDWSRPIEAVHIYGAVCVARVIDRDDLKVDDTPYYVSLTISDVRDWARLDGSLLAHDSWTIRNVATRDDTVTPEHPTPTQYAPELNDRAWAFVRNVAFHDLDVSPWAPDGIIKAARNLLSDLPQEVDPDEGEAAAILEAANFKRDRDPHYSMILGVTKEALARGRQLQRGEAA